MRAIAATAARGILERMKKLVAGARRAGPYLLVALLLPGGILIAAAMLFFGQRATK